MINRVKNINSFLNKLYIKHIKGFLQKEDGAYILLETGGRIYIDRGTEIVNRQKLNNTIINRQLN